MKKVLLLLTLSTGLFLTSTPARAEMSKAQVGLALIGGAIVTALGCEAYIIAKDKLSKLRKFCCEKPHWPLAATASIVGLCLICQDFTDGASGAAAIAVS